MLVPFRYSIDPEYCPITLVRKYESPLMDLRLLGILLLCIVLLVHWTMLRLQVRGTVLSGAVLWTGFAILMVSLSAIVTTLWPNHRWQAELHWFALVASFCPFIARLGAKRPQDRAWFWIVLTFWVVAGWPAWESWLTDRDPASSWLRDAMFGILVLMQIADCAATRAWLGSWLLAIGQILWHPQFQTLFGESTPFWLVLLPLVLGVAAMRIVIRAWRPLPPSLKGWDRIWQTIRDRMGVLWGLRIMERFNADLETAREEIRLTWSGFVVKREARPDADDAFPAVAELELINQLRRFADHDWIEEIRAQAVGIDSTDAMLS